MICDNPQCQWHFSVKNMRRDDVCVRVTRLAGTDACGQLAPEEITRYEYRIANYPGVSFYFCGARHSAVQMTL